MRYLLTLYVYSKFDYIIKCYVNISKNSLNGKKSQNGTIHVGIVWGEWLEREDGQWIAATFCCEDTE